MCISHLLSAILELEDSFAKYFLEIQNVDMLEVIGDMSRYELNRDRNDGNDIFKDLAFVGHEKSNKASMNKNSSDKNIHASDNDSATGWKGMVTDISEIVNDQNPLIGRKDELDRTIQILCRMDKNNCIHVGEPGVGKTAIIYGLAKRIETGDVPEKLKDAHIYSLDLGMILAGTQFRGDFEKKFERLIKGLLRETNPILYLDEIHNIVGAGATSGGSNDMANMLKPYLTDGRIKVIGATTYDEYKKYIEKNKSFLRRFQKLDIKEPSVVETVRILEGLRERYESFHHVSYENCVFEYAVQMSDRFINERFLPDKAIDLIDEAGANCNIANQSRIVDKSLIDEMLSVAGNIPKQRIEGNDIEKLASLSINISKKVFGQDEAVNNIVNSIKFSKAGISDENKPIASFLFVGATGVGKTELAKTLAEDLGIDFIRFDMSEYTENHTVAKLIGAPAGYVGYEEGGLLTDEVRKHPHAVLLLDEIEKAHEDIYNILLQVMDYATLTDNQGRKADFRNIILIMTSNAGAARMGKQAIGFEEKLMDEAVIDEAVNKIFKPEFRNRLSKIIVFNNMTNEMVKLIVMKKLNLLVEKLKKKSVQLIIDDSAIDLIIEKGFTIKYGAREIDRVIEQQIKPELVDAILFGFLKDGGKCSIKAKDGKILLVQ